MDILVGVMLSIHDLCPACLLCVFIDVDSYILNLLMNKCHLSCDAALHRTVYVTVAHTTYLTIVITIVVVNIVFFYRFQSNVVCVFSMYLPL